MATFTLMYGGSKSGTTSMADSKYGGCSSLYFPEDNPIQTLVMWGTCTSYHAPSGSGRAIAELRAREQGLNMVVVDPRFTPDAAMADVWLPIRPGTDVALMMTWIRYIIENKLYDEDFCKRWTNLPYLIDTDTKKMLRAYEVGLGEGAAMAVRRSAGPRVLRHVRDRRRRIPHGVHAAAGARGRMDARKGLRGMLP